MKDISTIFIKCDTKDRLNIAEMTELQKKIEVQIENSALDFDILPPKLGGVVSCFLDKENIAPYGFSGRESVLFNYLAKKNSSPLFHFPLKRRGQAPRASP